MAILKIARLGHPAIRTGGDILTAGECAHEDFQRFIDDLVDTGKPLDVVRKSMPKAHVATIYAKPMGRAQVDTFITEVSQDTWIFFPWDMALQYVEPYRGSD